VLIPAGLDVGRSHHSRKGAGPRVGVDVSIVNIEPSLLWYGAFAAANYVRGAELAFGPELGIAVLGIDAGPVWRSSEPGHGWGARTRAHVTWLFTSFYVGYAAFPQAGSSVLELGLHWKCVPWLVAELMHPGEGLAATVNRIGWSRSPPPPVR
jgi:hypothetical protein